MIEETERLIEHDLSSNIEEVDKKDQMQGTYEEGLNIQGRRWNLFFIQLLISSLLIWSLLFIKDSSYGEQLFASLNEVLSQNINVEPVEQVINDLMVAVKQIL